MSALQKLNIIIFLSCHTSTEIVLPIRIWLKTGFFIMFAISLYAFALSKILMIVPTIHLSFID